MKYKLGRKAMKEFVAPRPKLYSYLTENGCAEKKKRDTKKSVSSNKISNLKALKSVWKTIRHY